MCKVIIVTNLKGGCAKTTTTVNIACGLARRNQKVLLLDLDAQGSACLTYSPTKPYGL